MKIKYMIKESSVKLEENRFLVRSIYLIGESYRK